MPVRRGRPRGRPIGEQSPYAQRRKESTPQAAARLVPAWPADAARARAEETTRHRFLRALRDGDRIDARTFDLYVRWHPLVANLARGLVWGRYVSNARTAELSQSFRIDDALALRDVDDAPIELPARGWFGVAHPLELEQLEPQLGQRWQGRLAAAKVEPTFEQLGRPLPPLDDAQLAATELTHFAGRRVGFHRIRDVLRSRGWFDGEENDGGGTDDFGLQLHRSGGFAQAMLGYGEITELVAGKGKSYTSYSVRQPMSWMHPIDRAEVLADIEAAVGPARAARPARASSARAAERPAGSASSSSASSTSGALSTSGSGSSSRSSSAPATVPEGEVLPQRGRYPFAELAKSSRSKCVVCGEKIEKGTVRIGVERVIETPNFTGRGAAYLHPA